jgi:tetratricopeptide (TPR) repeat protein
LVGGAVLLVMVCALAFLLASTPARNSDLWLHLASGRALVRGQAERGIDPFASTTADAFWVNHSWLGDVLLYAVYQLSDGRGLVIAKGLLVALVAGLVFAFRRPGTGWGVAALAAAGTALALGPWLAPQPALLSLPGVVLTLYLLERGRRRWLLLPLFALWANLDAWFVLGPALVALYALGEALGRAAGFIPAVRTAGTSPAARQPRELASLALLTVAGLAACLLTPYGYRTFAWPTPLGLSHTEQALMHDPLGQGLVVSPFAGRFPSGAAFASPGGWAYCLLLAAGLVSFGLRGRALHPGRLLAWLALAALSAYQARAIPFFAVAAGPVLVLNLQEWAPEGAGRRWRAVGAGLGVAAGVALLVVAWPGWLQPAPYQPRGWAVERDESLARLAGRLEQWHAEGRLRPDRFALTFSPEVAHYLAWFGPSEKGFLDSRWPLFDPVADDFLTMRRCLLRPEGDGPAPQLGPLLDAHRLDRVILHDPDWDRTTAAFRCLLAGGDEWELVALEGNAAVFGRRPAGEASPSWEPLDWRRAAYHPDRDHRAPSEPTRPPEPARLFDPFYRRRPERSPDRGEAALDLMYFDFRAGQTRSRLVKGWVAAQACGLLAAGPGSEAAGTAGTLAARLFLTPLPPSAEGGPRVADRFAAAYLAAQDQGPAEALLPAVRAARRALAANPDDARALLLLGEAYVRLARQTREAAWGSDLSALPQVRQAQIMTALEQAVLLRPDLDRGHDLLAQLYIQGGQLDYALDHLRARLRIADDEVERRGPGAAAAAERQPALRAAVEAMEGLVRRAEGVYAANIEGLSGDLNVLARVRVAEGHGLTKKALEMLLASNPAKFGNAGTLEQLGLMLRAGRAYEVRDWLAPEYEEELGPAAYHSLRVQADAACGDYAGADRELAGMAEGLLRVAVMPGEPVEVRRAVALQVGGAVLARPAPGSGAAGLADSAYQRSEWLRRLDGPAGMLRQQADVSVLRGLLALEAGDAAAARGHFAAALEVWDGGRPGAGLDFLARPIAEHEMRRLDEAGAGKDD